MKTRYDAILREHQEPKSTTPEEYPIAGEPVLSDSSAKRNRSRSDHPDHAEHHSAEHHGHSPLDALANHVDNTWRAKASRPVRRRTDYAGLVIGGIMLLVIIGGVVTVYLRWNSAVVPALTSNDETKPKVIIDPMDAGHVPASTSPVHAPPKPIPQASMTKPIPSANADEVDVPDQADASTTVHRPKAPVLNANGKYYVPADNVIKAIQAREGNQLTSQTSAQLLDRAVGMASNPAIGYVLLQTARRQAIDEGEARTAIRAADLLQKRYELNGLKLRMETLRELRAGTLDANDWQAITPEALAVSIAAENAGDRVVASEAALLALQSARKTSGVPAIRKATLRVLALQD
jgi:hypothetical protein